MRTGSLLLAAVLASAAGVAPASGRPGLPVYRSFGDWIVACDNSGACEARGFTDDDRRGLYPRLVRPAGVRAEPVLEIRDLPERGAAIVLGGRPWRPADPRALAWVAADSRGDEGRFLRIRGEAAVREFVHASRRAGTVSVGNESGTLTGFNAAVLFIDDVQGRVGTPGALARPGTSRAVVPGPRPLPVAPVPARGVRALGADAARRYAAALPIPPDACEDDAGESPAELYALGNGEVLALVRCWHGSYQDSHVVYRGPRDAPARARPVTLPIPPGIEASDGSEPLIGASFDPATGTLSAFGRARGPADCGDTSTWVFDGRRFHMTEYALLDRCGWYAPGDFPVLWRTARAPGAP